MEPKVAILLGTCNGQFFIEDQLDSLANQTFENWVLIVSDDASSDETLEIIKQKTATWPNGKVTIRQGPLAGFSKNFLSMACDQSIVANYYAFCDQDDIWLPGKIEEAIRHIKANENITTPFLYCSRTAYVQDTLTPYAYSPLFTQKKEFRNALFQNIAGGNTMVFNNAAKKLIERVGVPNVVFHDWWLYQLISGVGGSIYYDEAPLILYRQHDDSIIGGETALGIIHQLWRLFRGDYKESTNIHLNALHKASSYLASDSQEVLNDLTKLKQSRSIIDRIRIIKRLGVHRQSRIDTWGLRIAAVLGLI